MAVIGITARPTIREKVLELINEVRDWAEKENHTILLDRKAAELLGGIESEVTVEQLLEQSELIVSLGGDGTLIGTARHVKKSCPLFVGVNFGKLGFLTEISPEEVIPVLESVFNGSFKSDTRSLLNVRVLRNDKIIFEGQAINDAVIQKGVRDKIIILELFSDEEKIMRVSGDGLILSTPTGSTAYSLSSGGSIVHPALEALLVTPICAHSLTTRPLVLSAKNECRVSIPEDLVHEGDVVLTVDGQESCDLILGDSVFIKQAECQVRFVRSPEKSYFDILKNKLNWAIENKN